MLEMASAPPPPSPYIHAWLLCLPGLVAGWDISALRLSLDGESVIMYWLVLCLRWHLLPPPTYMITMFTWISGRLWHFCTKAITGWWVCHHVLTSSMFEMASATPPPLPPPHVHDYYVTWISGWLRHFRAKAITGWWVCHHVLTSSMFEMASATHPPPLHTWLLSLPGLVEGCDISALRLSLDGESVIMYWLVLCLRWHLLPPTPPHTYMHDYFVTWISGRLRHFRAKAITGWWVCHHVLTSSMFEMASTPPPPPIQTCMITMFTCISGRLRHFRAKAITGWWVCHHVLTSSMFEMASAPPTHTNMHDNYVYLD